MRCLSFTHKIRAAFALVMVCGSLLCMPAATVQAIEQGGIGGRPAHPKADNPRTQSIFVHTVRPGGQVKDAVEVINNSPETKRVLVYAVDSQTSSGGAFACAQAADKPFSVGRWIELTQKELVLASGAKQTVEFTIEVPKGITPGEHNGCIVIQDTKQQTAPDRNGIVLSLRSAIRVAIRVPGNIQKGLVFTGLSMERKGETKVLLTTALKNNGNVSLDTQLDLKLKYAFGLSALTAGGNFPVLASSEGRYNFETNRPFWGGWYRLTAAAQYNDNPEVSLGEGMPTATLRQSMWVFVAPQPLAAVIQAAIIVVLVGSASWLLRRRTRHKHAMRRATKHTVKSHENLHTIAEAYKMHWKRLAHINKLKPPYQLKTGQTLIVTPPTDHRKKSSSRP